MNALSILGMKIFRQLALVLLLSSGVTIASAQLFGDDEARKAILDLRQRVETVRLESEKSASTASEDSALLRRSLLELQSQIESLRSELAKLVGANEHLSRDITEIQLRQKDLSQGVDDRLRQFEPVKVVDGGREFLADPAEKREYEAALAVFRQGDFSSAQTLFLDFRKRYTKSGYAPLTLFWLANAQYATRSYKEAVINFRALVAGAPEHSRAPEAVLSIANCQIELKDIRGARKTLEDLIKAYPMSEAAIAAKERLQRLK